MTTTTARSSSSSSRQRTLPPFALLLKGWRERRKCSQLDLALDAGVSQRHLSFLESGRAQPSREMILQLAEVLDVPLRERNQLLHAAGFAPVFAQRELDNDEMDAVRQALEMMLRHHEPFPALVVNREWNLVLANTAAQRFIGLLGNPDEVWHKVDPSGQRNVMRMTFASAGMQPLLSNWDQVATLLLSRLQREVAADPTHTALRELFDDLSQLPHVVQQWHNTPWNDTPPPILPLALGLGDHTLNVFTMISTFGTALDITAEELRVETFFPMDDFSRQFFLQLAEHK